MTGNIILINLILWPFASALICYLAGWKKHPYGSDGSIETKEQAKTRKDYRNMLVWSAVAIEVLLYIFAIISSEKNGYTLRIEKICGLGIGLRFGGFRTIYAGVALLMWSMTALFSREYFAHYRNRNRYYFFFMLTLGATLGVFMSDDLYTAFIFFEIMSFTSYTWVAHDEKSAAMKAAGTYLAVAVIGGLVMLMGIMMLHFKLGTLQIDQLCEAASVVLNSEEDVAYMFAAGIMILFGFGAKAGMFPLHIWLPKAHPVAPAPASALLSGVLTKSGVYGVLLLCFEIFRENKSWGTLILVLGVITMFTGAVLAVFSIDLKRTLACSSMSQIGFILTGCATSVFLGHENSLAAAGTVLYMVNHSLFKLVLFMCAGAIYMKLHKLDLNEIRGFGRGNKFLTVMFAIGALGIMGVPLFSGYISKTLIHEGIVEFYGELSGGGAVAIKIVEYLFLLSGGMTIGYMLKLFIAIFIEKPAKVCDEKDVKWSISLPSAIALIVPAGVIIVCGCITPIYIEHLSVYMSDITRAPEIEHISIFSLENLKGFVISLTIGLLVYLFIRKVLMKKENGVKVYVNRWPKGLDLEELLYRPLILKLLPNLFAYIFKFFIKLTEIIWAGLLIFGRNFAKALVRSVGIVGNFILILGKSLGLFASMLGETIIYYIQKIFFKNLVENKRNPFLEKWYARFEEGDRVFRLVGSTISYSIIWLLLGLIGTVLFLLFY